MTARRVRTAVTVVAVTAVLAGYGTHLFGAGTPPGVPGEVVTLGAQGSTLGCPAPVALAGEILAPAGTETGGSGSGDVDFGSSPVAPRSTVQVSVFGAQTSSTLEPFAEVSAAASVTGAAGEAAAGDWPRSVAGRDPSAQLRVDGVESATILRSTASAGQDADAYAAMSSVTSAGDLRGLAAAACQEPGITQWLVGGATTLGTTTELVLSNPTRTPATVTVDLWGAGGPLVLAGPSTYLVPPGGQVTTLLGGLAAEQNRLVARVSTSGALVTAYLQHTVLDGLTPLGVDYVTAGAEPATAQVLTGVAVEASEVTDADVATLRVLAPQTSGTASIRVLGADGQQVLRGAETIDLTAGAVTDVSLAGLPAGTYTVLVQADTDIVAGAQITRTGELDPAQPMVGRPTDRAWVAARHDASGAGTAAVPADTQALVVLTALPADLDGAVDVAAQVPIVYADGVTDPLAAGWTASPRGQLRAYGADGALLGSKEISLAPGQTVVVDPSTVSGGKPVAAVTVVTGSSGGSGSGGSGSGDGGAVDVGGAGTLTLDWAVLLAAPQVSGSVALVQPTSPTVTGGSLTVHRSATVGLPLG